MSYCRWSSDNWKCDLYCYEDVSGGWTTHVAGRRRVGLDILPPDPMMDVAGYEDGDAWNRQYREHRKILEALPFEDIDLPQAGETFNDPTLEDFKARLLYLRGVGYHFPDHVLDQIDEEIADAAAEKGNTG